MPDEKPTSLQDLLKTLPPQRTYTKRNTSCTGDMKVNIAVPILFALLLLALLYALRQSRQSRSAPPPPGPPGYPFIGNVLSMSQPKLWLTFAEWAKTYGPIMSLTVPSHRFIVLNTYEAASTLMGRHSDRMHLPMAGALHTVVSLMLHLIYGYEVKEDDDEYIAIFLPGMNFKRKAKEWRESLEKMATIPFELAKSRNPELETPQSYVSSLIDSEPLELQEEIKWVAVSIYAATLDAFLLAMILNPDVQRRAQRELDEVLSQQTVTLNHRQHLPYMDALCKEVYRFHTVVPTGIGHCAEKDDVYGGYCIQKGDVILANQWSMAHDPDVYRDPFQFDPDRFVKRSERDPRDICFGFGTRILSSFDVVPMNDEPPPTWDTVDGMICHVTPFNYLLVPRRTSHECVP
ncbi:cytochrome P450 [Hymenopellis radicata]|nr:cytochrome P450 [Hymenopellis radicata]